MAYIGKSIESGTFSVLDTSGNTYNGSNTAFNLGTQVGSVAQLLVSHDGVIQKPGTDYTLSSGGAAITFTTAPASGASIFIVEISGAVGGPLDSDLNGTELILDADGDTSLHASTDDQIDIKVAGADDFKFTANTFTANSGSGIVVPDGGLTFGSTAISSTAAELNILDGVTATAAEINLIDGGTSRGTTAIADGDGVLINDAGTMRQTTVETLKTYIGGGIVEADQWRVSANESTWTSSGRHYITSDWERVDNSQFEHIGSGMSESSGVFTFPSTGKYYIRFQLDWTNREGGTNRALTYMMAEIGVTANNSSYSQFAHGNSSNSNTGAEYYHSVATTYILDVSDVSNIKTKFGAYIANPMKYLGNTGYNKTHVTFIKLGDT